MNNIIRKPDVIFAGLQKAGTSFLRGYFTLHSGIAWSREAICFMVEPFDPNKLGYPQFQDVSADQCFIDMYESLAIGYLEQVDSLARRDYLLPDFDLNNYEMPPIDLIPKRIKQVLPDAKIIITLRNQVDWLRSNYLHFIPYLDVKKNRFGDFLHTLEGMRLLHAGQYDRIIATYYDIFGKEKVHVILLEDLHHKLDDTLQRLCAFLDVEFVNYPKNQWQRNQGRPKAEAGIIRWLSHFGLSTSQLASMPPFVKDTGRRMQSLIGNRPVVSEGDKILLRAFYAVSNRNTSNLINIDLKSRGYYYQLKSLVER